MLTEENALELLARAAYRTTAEVDHLVASMRPRQAPREGIRLLPGQPAAQLPTAGPAATAGEAACQRGACVSKAPRHEGPPAPLASPEPPAPLLDTPRPRADLRAVSEDRWSLRVTVDRALKEDLETLSTLLSHVFPKGDLAAVLHEAIRCGIEKHGKRKGAVKPTREMTPKARPPKDPAAIPAEMRRRVWERDGGRCAFTTPDGRRCGSRWKLEVDHVRPPSRGGTATIDNLRLACRAHNLLHAEEVYGRELMEKYRKGESTAGAGSTAWPVAREAHATG